MTEEHTSTAQLEEATWHLGERILFRFAFCYIVLYYLPSVLRVIPGTGVPLGWYHSLWNHIVGWVAVYLFNLDAAQALPHPTGSGDTALAYLEQGVILTFAIAGGILWAILDRRRRHYTSLH